MRKCRISGAQTFAHHFLSFRTLDRPKPRTCERFDDHLSRHVQRKDAQVRGVCCRAVDIVDTLVSPIYSAMQELVSDLWHAR